MMRTLPLLLCCCLFLAACPNPEGTCKADGDCAKNKACCGNKCIDVENDKNNCGGCGVTCEAPNSTPTCRVGRCQLQCASGFGNCNGDREDGCEQDLTATLSSCGVCGRVCMGNNSTPVCRMAMCQVASCSQFFADCDLDSTTGCEVDTRTDSKHCGGCGQACMLPNSTSFCEGSQCAVDTCAATFADCNLQAFDGCEASLPTDAMNCGRCGYACGPGQFCAASKCRANELIAFGGALSFTMSGATAEVHRFNLQTNAWEQVVPAAPNGAPSPRSRHVAVWDLPRNRMVVWGGVDGAGTPAGTEVWALEFATTPPRWAQVTTTGLAPSPRFAAPYALDPDAQKLYLFGGTTELGAGLSDLFTFDLATNAWAQVHGANAMNAPRDRVNAMGAFDPVAKVFLVFGGNDAVFRNDFTELWQFDVTAQRWKTPPITNLEGGPPGRARGMFTDGHPVHLYSGIQALLVPPASIPEDLRTLDVTATTPWMLEPGALTQPQGRFNAAATTRDGLVFLYSGGSTVGGMPQVFSDLWKYDPAASAWTRLHDGTGTVPAARLAPSIIAR